MIITGTSLRESKMALQMAKRYGALRPLHICARANLHNIADLYATVGCHPTRSNEFDKFGGGPDAYLKALGQLIKNNLSGKGRVVAIGECGLDYDRTRFASEAVQRKHFRSQLALAKEYHLPLFLHSRAAHADFVKILRQEGFGTDGGRGVGANGGLVHSFTGTAEEAKELMDMGFHLSVNGCSLKTQANLKAAQSLPLDRLLLETDAPWCSMTSMHASKAHLDRLPANLRSLYFPDATRSENFVPGKPVKGRNEPMAIGGVAWVLHRLHPQVPFHELTELAWKNTVDLFKLEELR
jgi:TatD DNase family protein